MLSTIFFMSNDKRHKITSRQYEIIKLNYSKFKSIKYTGKGNPMYGKNYQSYAIVEFSKNRKGKSNIEIYGDMSSLMSDVTLFVDFSFFVKSSSFFNLKLCCAPSWFNDFQERSITSA